MDIHKLPGSIAEIESLFAQHGSISFIIREKNKFKHSQALKRLNKLDFLVRKYSHTKIGKLLIITPYMLYVGLLHSILVRNDPGLRIALTIYEGAWKNISNIDGKILDNGNCRVIYHGRT